MSALRTANGSALRPRTGLGRAGAVGAGASLNMTPMVDVVLVILVFFMASASIAGPEWFLSAIVEARTPTVDAVESPAPADTLPALPDVVVPVRLSVDERGNVGVSVFGEAPIILAEARATLASLVGGGAADEVIVRLEADGGVPWDAVVRTRDVCSSLGIERVVISARP